MAEKHFPGADILLPKKALGKWAVIACDQFTSERSYWEQADALVGDSPSSLRVILPEVYLEDKNVEARTEEIYRKMDEYLSSDILAAPPRKRWWSAFPPELPCAKMPNWSFPTCFCWWTIPTAR